jgi:phytoene synthase
MCVAIMGRRRRGTDAYAVQMGYAVQRTNILRDLRDDARRERVYLPEQTLAHYGLTLQDALALKDADATDEVAPAWDNLVVEEARRVHALYRRARRFLSRTQRRALALLEVMGAVYEALLRRIEQLGAAAITRPVKLSGPQRLSVVAGSLTAAVLGLPWAAT